MAIKPIEETSSHTGPNCRARRHPENNPPARRWASMKDAAEYLGVSTRTIRQMIADGKFRGYRANARLFRVDLNEVDAALEPFGGAA
ncbi:DNA binding domain, excisionase family [Mycobacterium avium subsp. avium]|nr:helix-turn-helix domain-containing protein [Mycobacterium avium]ETB12500.1 hypothetical protein P863_06635 [Mycobacterium avium subsp. silvaticum ATCC 49884]ETB19532.1 hypothetical protein O972_05605 [Mycobacterium avium subsp. avium 10-9275]ETB23029.1 hypothetical protein O973_05525 [Mycobacterium avium subsp. avium 11-4751]QGW32309.1 DNA binding domain, excisionase family [Mycobacterium avium subsp. avium]